MESLDKVFPEPVKEAMENEVLLEVLGVDHVEFLVPDLVGHAN